MRVAWLRTSSPGAAPAVRTARHRSYRCATHNLDLVAGVAPDSESLSDGVLISEIVMGHGFIDDRHARRRRGVSRRDIAAQQQPHSDGRAESRRDVVPLDDSFFIRIRKGGTELLPLSEWATGIHKTWEWAPVELGPQKLRTFNLPAGLVLLEIIGREDGTKIDQILITANDRWKP